jgi:hypothetical protein
MELFTPRYVPSKPFGIALKSKTEFAVVNMENPTTIRHIDNIANDKSTCPEKMLIKNAAINTPITLGRYARIVDFSSPNFDMIFGTTKKIAAIVHVWIKYRVNTVESDSFSVLRNGVSAVK